MMLVVGATVGLLMLFLWHANLGRIGADLERARPGLLLLALGTIGFNWCVRSLRWQCLLRPLGPTRFVNVLRATVVGFAASAILPARPGEVIRPYWLTRHEPLSTAGAFATIIVERLLDILTVLLLFAAFVLWFDPLRAGVDPGLMDAIKVGGVLAGGIALALLAVLMVLAGHPARLSRLMAPVARRLPARLAGRVERLADRFASGLAVVRRPRYLLAALTLSFVLWLSIAAGVWAVAQAFAIRLPFTGAFLMLMLLVVGVAVPTPGAIGGFHEAFRLGAVAFYAASADRAIAAALVLHAISYGPVAIAGLTVAAHEGLNLAGIRQLARKVAPGGQAA